MTPNSTVSLWQRVHSALPSPSSPGHLPGGKPRPRLHDGGRLKKSAAGWASASSTSPASTRPTAPASRASAAWGWRSRSPSSPTSARNSASLLTDVHENGQCAEVLDGRRRILQIPALPLPPDGPPHRHAGKTGRGQRQGQFLALGHEERARQGGGEWQPQPAERGASFGYNTLVSDMRALPIMAETGAVIFDATPRCSSRRPGCLLRRRPAWCRCWRVPPLRWRGGRLHRNAPGPGQRATPGGPNMVPLDKLERLLVTLMALDKVSKAMVP